MSKWPYNTATWQRLRRAKLSEQPLCETCELLGKITPALDVDHIVSIKSGGPAFPEMNGLRALCHSCHSIKTTALDRRGGKGVAIRGCDVNGLPLDPAHPFLTEDNPLGGSGAEVLGPTGGNKIQLVRDWSV